MTPGVYNITAKQGATWVLSLNWATGDPPQTVALAGYTGKLIVRYKPASADVLLEASTANARIVLGGNPNNIVVTVDKTVMLGLAPGNYHYDLELTSAGGVDYPVLTGRFEVQATTVRP